MMRTLFTSSRNGLLIAHATEGIGSLLTICILWMGSFLVIDRLLSAGELLSFYTLAAFFTNPVLSLIGANGAMQDALIAADRLFEIIDMETEMDIFPVKGLERLPVGDLILRTPISVMLWNLLSPV
jgi:ATP-binding cassette subfamily B protein